MADNQEVYVLDEASMVRLWQPARVDSGAMNQAEANRFWNDYVRGGSRHLATYFGSPSGARQKCSANWSIWPLKARAAVACARSTGISPCCRTGQARRAFRASRGCDRPSV
jgi:hypothetical protein